MQRVAGSSIRVSAQTRRRVGSLVRRLQAASQQEVIDKALDALERQLFWAGFDQEAKAYLASYPQEEKERQTFGHTLADGVGGNR